MSYEFYEHKRRDRLKWIIVFGAIFLLAVFVLAANTNGFTDTDPYGWFTEDETPAPNNNNTDAETPDTDGIELPDGSESELPIEIVNSEFMRMSAMAYTSPEGRSGQVKLTATTMPENSDPGQFIWEIYWSNPTSDWIGGRSVEDYVQITIDGNECYVEALDSFAEPVFITVYATNNPNAVATCTVHYAARFLIDQYINVNGTALFVSRDLYSDGMYDAMPIQVVGKDELRDLYMESLYFSTSFNDYYTINGDVTGEVCVYATHEFAEALEAAGLLEDINGVTYDIKRTITDADILNGIGAGKIIPTRYSDEADIEKINKFNEVVASFGEEVAFVIEVKLSTDYASTSNSYYMSFETGNIEFYPITAELSNDVIIL